MDEQQPFIDTQLQSTQAHLREAIATLNQGKAPAELLIGYTLMLKMAQDLEDKAQRDRKIEDSLDKLFKKFDNR